MADNSPTSGGPGDTLRTEDTQLDTNTGVLGVKMALGKLNVGRKGQDSGAASLDTPLDVYDPRQAGILRDGLERVASMLAGVYQALAQNGVVTRALQGRSLTLTGVSFSTTSVLLAKPVAGRLMLRIVNDNSAAPTLGNLFCRVGSGAASIANGGYSFILTPGSTWEARPEEVEQGVTGIWASTTTSGFANITEIGG
jgi:hypothetical protein